MKATVEHEVETKGGVFRNVRAFSSFSVDDVKKAARFYGETLGLDVVEKKEGLELRISGCSPVFVYPKGDHVPATFTILNFPIDDIDDTVAELTKRGARFEVYRDGEMKTDERGIARGHGMKIAWFKDPAGNFLSVIEQ